MKIQRSRRQFSASEYWRMEELGFFTGQRVELLNGDIVAMPPQSNWHAIGISYTSFALESIFNRNRYWIRIQNTLDLSPLSIPDPDIAVIEGGAMLWAKTRKNPKSALLIVEVSETTLADDRARKGRLYAAAGIADYWILNLVEGVLEIHRDPVSDPSHELGCGYSKIDVLKPGEFASPLAAPNGQIAIADLLPG